MNLITIEKVLKFKIDGKTVKWKFENGNLIVLMGDKPIPGWEFQFPEIEEGYRFVLGGTTYLIPRYVIDEPVIQPKRNWFWVKPLLGEAEPVRADTRILVSKDEYGDYPYKDFVLSNVDFNAAQVAKFPYRKVPRDKIIDIMIRNALWMALQPFIMSRDEKHLKPEYMVNRIYAMLTDTRIFIPLIYGTVLEEKINETMVVNRAYPDYNPDWYFPSDSGKEPGKRGYFGAEESLMMTLQPYIKYMEPKRQAIFYRNIKQAQAIADKLDDMYPLTLVTAAFVNPKDYPQVSEDALTISKEVVEKFSGYQLIKEKVDASYELLVNVGDTIEPRQEIAEREGEIWYTRKLVYPGEIISITTANGYHKILIKSYYPLTIGDKLASAFGFKGIVSFIKDMSVDIIFESKRLTAPILLDILYFEAGLEIEEYIKLVDSCKTVQELADKIGFDLNSLYQEIRIGDKYINAVVVDMYIMRLSQNAADKITYNSMVIENEFGKAVRTVTKTQRFQRLSRDVTMFSQELGIDLLPLKHNPKIARYAKDLYNILTNE